MNHKKKVIKKESKINFILILLFGIFIISCNGCSQTTTKKTGLKQMLIEYTNDLVRQRKEYEGKLSEIKSPKIGYGLTYIKDTLILKLLKNSIIEQKIADNWNYKTGLVLSEKWKMKFDSLAKIDKSKDVQDFYSSYNAQYFKVNKEINELENIENSYLNKYYELICFYYDENLSIKIMNDEIAINNMDLLYKYNGIITQYVELENKFNIYLANWRKTKVENVKELNKTLKIYQVDTLVKMIEN